MAASLARGLVAAVAVLGLLAGAVAPAATAATSASAAVAAAAGAPQAAGVSAATTATKSAKKTTKAKKKTTKAKKKSKKSTKKAKKAKKRTRAKATRGSAGTTTTAVATAPATPTGLRATSVSATSVSLSWRAVGAATSYDIYRNGAWAGSSRSTTWTGYGLAPGTRYTVQVVALAGSRWSARSTAVPVTTRAAAPVATPTTMPQGDLPGWRQVFAEDFATPAARGTFTDVYAPRWDAYPQPWRDTSGKGMYSPQRTLSVSDGQLRIWLHSEGGQPYVAAPLPRLPQMTYGRFSVRFRADAVPGYKLAFLLWPDSETWPLDGEIDFPEGDLTGRISAFAHHADAAGGQDAFPTTATFTGWHVATTEWAPGRVTFLLDGVVIGVSTTDVPDRPMHVVLQTETTLDATPVPATASGTVQVDWFTAYTLAR